MAYFIQLVFAGVALGCIYALIGLGFTIIFKASEVINFAQGELVTLGATVAFMLAWSGSGPPDRDGDHERGAAPGRAGDLDPAADCLNAIPETDEP